MCIPLAKRFSAPSTFFTTFSPHRTLPLLFLMFSRKPYGYWLVIGKYIYILHIMYYISVRKLKNIEMRTNDYSQRNCSLFAAPFVHGSRIFQLCLLRRYPGVLYT